MASPGRRAATGRSLAVALQRPPVAAHDVLAATHLLMGVDLVL